MAPVFLALLPTNPPFLGLFFQIQPNFKHRFLGQLTPRPGRIRWPSAAPAPSAARFGPGAAPAPLAREVRRWLRWLVREMQGMSWNDSELSNWWLFFYLFWGDPQPCGSPLELAVGQNQWYHFGAGAPPILVYFSGDWDVHWGYRNLTRGQLGSPMSWNDSELNCAGG